ncbi:MULTISPECIES: recombinase family protein [unclassified Streptomyces]|uniref:recombinase family protein n=1 Tax=unclassified Streptomyces TaxID=2593676 RepID=UPI000DC7EBCA|nr:MULTISPECIES: recombinase family protein [unclassified Streptomyces]AWZ05263.1 recombinase family protein [Streptomyces sp. ICC4]AWZ12778.1 recombinase family protein [Streptomyces sp. ICC1]
MEGRSATQQVDARTATGRLQRGILFEFAAYESDKLGEQWRETHDHRRYKLGLPATGRPRAGYVWHPRRLPDGKGGWTVQKERYEPGGGGDGAAYAEAYRRYVGGASYYALCGWLNTHGYLTVRGNPWSVQVLTRYMDSGFAAGLLRVHDTKCTCEHTNNCPNHIFIPGAHEELIAPELWQQYQEERARRGRRMPPGSVKPLYPLTNLAKCDHCRGTAPVESGERKGLDGRKQLIRGYSYCCGRRSVTSTHGCSGFWVRRSIVEADLYDWIAREAAAGFDAAPAVPHQRPTEQDDRVRAAKERVRLQTTLDKLAAGLTRLRADHAINPDDYAEGEYESARDRIKEQQNVTTALLEKVAGAEATPDRADFEPLIFGLAQEWDSLLNAEKNALLKQLVRRVTFRRHDGGDVVVAIHPLWEPDPWAGGDETSSLAEAPEG